MKRNELFDEVLNHLYEHSDRYWITTILCEDEFNTNDHILIESIVDEMIKNDWVSPKNHSKYSVIIKYEGKQIIEKYGSYSSYLDSENVAQKNAQRRRITNEVIKIGTPILFGLSAAILGWLNYSNAQKIDFQKKEIKVLNLKIDSLKTKEQKKSK